MVLEAVERKFTSLITCISENKNIVDAVQDCNIYTTVKKNAQRFFPEACDIHLAYVDNTTLVFNADYITRKHPEDLYGRIHAVIFSALVDESLADSIIITDINTICHQ